MASDFEDDGGSTHPNGGKPDRFAEVKPFVVLGYLLPTVPGKRWRGVPEATRSLSVAPTRSR